MHGNTNERETTGAERAMSSIDDEEMKHLYFGFNLLSKSPCDDERFGF
jgi:hypothetical protein